MKSIVFDTIWSTLKLITSKFAYYFLPHLVLDFYSFVFRKLDLPTEKYNINTSESKNGIPQIPEY